MIGTNGPDTLVGTDNADFIDGGGGDDRIFGLGGSDELIGGEGADLIDGGAGVDQMSGSAGDDIYVVDDAGDVVIEAAGGGSDFVYTSVSYTLSAEVENISVAGWRTTYAIDLTGNGLNNYLYGNDGANLLDGGAGADLMIGFAGNDTYLVDNAGDAVYEGAGGGGDIIYASVSYALSDAEEVEQISVAGWRTTYAINLTGSASNNYLYGNDGANTLNGGGGADWMVGFAGDDTYIVDHAGDAVYEAAGNGNDIIFASVSYALSEAEEVEQISVAGWRTTYAIDLTGSNSNNYLYGNDGANTLDGKGGADRMLGFAGDDTYLVDTSADEVFEDAGNGSDWVIASTSYTLGSGVSIEYLSAAGWRTTNAIDLTGNDLANTIYGNDGANVLNGGGGADLLMGFAGNDTFAFTTALGAGNIDQVNDFQPGLDRIVLGGNATEPFSALASGQLRTGAFLIGSVALDADDYILYNVATGALSYDADGNGAGSAVQFARVAAGLNLSASDFVVSGPANALPTVTSGTTASIAENSPTSTIVYQAVATDADGDTITFSLGGADAAAFTIDSRTGTVRFAASPDFEATSQYAISVLAADSAGSTAKAVTINVIDVGDTGTPVIAERAGENSNGTFAQPISRSSFVVAENQYLTNDLLPSVTIKGTISDSNDVDVFKVDLEAGELLILDVDFAGGNLDSFLRLFSASSTLELVSNDDMIDFDPGSVANAGVSHNTDSFIRFRALTTGQHHIWIESYQDPSRPTSGDYQIQVSIGPPATPEQLLAEDADALLSGRRWSSLNLTYAFPDSYTDFPAGFGDGEATASNGFEAFNVTQRVAAQDMLGYIAQVTQLTFQTISDPFGSTDGSANIRFAESNLPEVAYAYLPGSGPESGSTWFNHANFNNPVRGNYAWMGIYHEAGHALGLKHGHEVPAISRDHDSVEYTVMTYRSYTGASIGEDGGYTNESGGYPQTLMMLDIAALQKLYGANFTYYSGDTNYSWSPNTGQMFINGGSQWLPPANRIFMTIWDGGGNDTYDLSAYSGPVQIDLRPGYWTTTSGVQLANLGDGRMARGNIANALQYNDDPRSLIENAIGGSGNDILIGNRAANHLTGWGGADAFVWYTADDIGKGSGADTIMDFQSGQDKIDLRALDSILGTPSNDGFSFIGTSAFSNIAGQLRFQVEGNSVHIQGDVDGNGIADFDLLVLNTQNLTSSDFLL
ncbi:MAG: M10 family metallopeptidase C-terminal domain-containing protein [Allosphingosinicella sp.]